MLLYILKAQYVIWGLSAPRFAWWAAATLLVAPIAAILYLQWVIWREARVLRSAVKSIQRLKIERAAMPGHGLPASTYSNLAQVFVKPGSLRSAWLAFSSLLILQPGPEGEEQYWATDSAETAFGDTTLFAGRINRAFFTAIPGIVTGTGLLFTFLAILVALMDVRIDKSNQIQGLGLLIEGLSGKFVSSVAALSGATVFLLAEKPLFHRLTRARLNLVQTIDEIMPRLTPVRVLADLRQGISEQTSLFKSFNAQLSLKLKKTFGETVGANVQRMAEAIERLAQLLHEAEARKKENLTESLRSMLEDMQRSITAALQEMSQNFTETLSRTTKDEFGKVSQSLLDTAHLLEGMNSQFQMALSAFDSVLEMAKSSAVEQVALGRQQVDSLTAVMKQFMGQMNESAKGMVEMTKSAAAEQMALSQSQTNILTALMQQFMGQMNESTSGLVEMTKSSAAEQMERSRHQADDLTLVMRQLMVQMNETATSLVEMTKSSTAEQMQHSRKQMDELAGVMRELMIQMNESAKSLVEMTKSSSVEQMERSRSQMDELAGVMRQLMVQMNETAKGLVDMTKSSAAEQMERSRNQMDELTDVMRQLMVQMGETAKGLAEMTKSSAAEQMERSRNQMDELTDVMRQLMAQMNESAKGMVEMTKSSAAEQLERNRRQMDDLSLAMRQLMSKMNESASGMVEMAKSSAAEQAEHNKSQMDDLAAVMRQFMVQMNESAGSSVTRIAGALTGVMHDLSSNVSELQQKMADTMQQNTERAASVTSTVVEQAGNWSARSSQQLDQLMEQYEHQALQMKEAEATLVSVLKMVTASLEQQGALTSDLRKIAAEVSSMVTASAGATRSMELAQRNLANIAAQTALQLEEAHRAQKEVWTWIHDNIGQYQDFFGLTENRAQDVLAKMTQNLGQYIDASRQGYQRLIAEADGQLANATQKLGASVLTLTGFLQSLTESLKRVQRSADGRRS